MGKETLQVRTFKLPRGSPIHVGKYFAAYEFDCPCSNCAFTLIHEELLDKLDRLRELCGHPVNIHGFRCSLHQEQLKREGYETAKGTSAHELGMAADVNCGAFSGTLLAELARKAGFVNIGVGRSFIHVDVRPGGPREWSYKSR